MTQEQLGEKLGVSNKTVSRWETGTYLPPVEMLQTMGTLYGITINEILSAERLPEAGYQEKAEENIKAALAASAFSLAERVAFFKKKWRKEHAWELALGLLVAAALLCAGIFWKNGLQFVGYFWAIGFVLWRENQMMAYVESHAYDGSGQ